ncbi:NUDIX hydrolase [Marinobacterium aestuarii]|uniref:NAD(+) diphosphatase n=1 Tax=Marinobacterium aestuarii TaxID=1821621 RepID=A0A1A9EY26_9GAMM|nr:NAD(+) diphosphatase [Marinobacterium aestuarii]ANG62429.1 NUDIX hydrolase [Marinobacterium aestuarii]
MRQDDCQPVLLAAGGRLLQSASGGLVAMPAELEALHSEVIEAQYPLGPDAADGRLLVLHADTEPALRQPAMALRDALAQARNESEYGWLSRAAQLATWHEQHRFCGRCGAALIHHAQDLAKTCEPCGLSQYPRISPCIIVLVVRGDQCLLARAPHYAAGRFSTLAGFIEAGETAEAAVAREIQEEVSIEVQNVRYFKSQSWPFPHALMLGFFADYKAGELMPDGVEILEAHWFSRDNLPDLPPSFSISRQLIESYRRGELG